MTVGVGEHAMWGYSPTFNVVDLVPDVAKRDRSEVDVLLLGASDMRHVLESLRLRASWGGVKRVNFHVWEDTTECLARHLLLTRLATDQTISIESRVQTFLETYGNVVVHTKTSESLVAYAKALLKDMAKDQESVAPFFDLSQLKFKQRDAVEDALRFVRSPKGKFDAKGCHDRRSRHYLGSRYDSLANIIDWDYQMMVKDYAPIIHKLHYRRFRQQGLMVERQGKCTEPNKTLASFTAARHRKRGPVEVRGFWSDIVISPYIGFGVHADDSKFYERASDQYKKHTVDIAEYNLVRVLETLAPCTAVNDSKEEVAAGGGDDDILMLEAKGGEDASATAPASEEKKKRPAGAEAGAGDAKREAKRAGSAAAMSREPLGASARVYFLAGDIKSVLAKGRYRGKFDLVFVGQSTAQVGMSAVLNQCARPSGCAVVAETIKYIPAKPAEKVLYVQKLRELGAAAGWKNIRDKDTKSIKAYSFPMPEKKGNKDLRAADTHPESMVPFVHFEITPTESTA